MHLLDLTGRCVAAGADSPDRLIGDHRVGTGEAGRERAGKLPGNDLERPTRFALLQRLADADDGGEPRPVGRLGLGADDGIGLAMPGATLRMAEDHRRAPGVLQHFGGNIAGEGARGRGMTILPSHRDPGAAEKLHNRPDEGGGRTHHDVAAEAHALQHIGKQPNLLELRGEPVHFPVSGHQGLGSRHFRSFRHHQLSNPTRSHGLSNRVGIPNMQRARKIFPTVIRIRGNRHPMMEALRSSAGSWIAKIFIALLALSFGIWGIADVFRGRTTDVLASVGGKKITGEEYRRAFDRQVRVFSQQQGVQITPDQARAVGLDRQVLAQLLQEASLDAQAANLRLAISDAMIAERIASNKAFQGVDGQFDPNRFRQILASNGLSEGEVVHLEKESLLSGGIVDALTSGTEIPKTMAQIAWRHRYEQRDVRYFIIAGDKIVIPPPSDSDLKSFYDSHPQAFSVPERRTVATLAVTPQA